MKISSILSSISIYLSLATFMLWSADAQQEGSFFKTKHAIDKYYSELDEDVVESIRKKPLEIIPHDVTEYEDYVMILKPRDYNFKRKRGVVEVSDAYMARLKKDLGLEFEFFPYDNPLMQVVELHETSEAHIDAYPNDPSDLSKKRKVVDDTFTAFVMLNDNPDAHFQHGDTSVPITKGTMVKFAGNVPHNTVINSGHVSYLGPFDVMGLRGVGLLADTDPKLRGTPEYSAEEHSRALWVEAEPCTADCEPVEDNDGTDTALLTELIDDMDTDFAFCTTQRDYAGLVNTCLKAAQSDEDRDYIRINYTQNLMSEKVIQNAPGITTLLTVGNEDCLRQGSLLGNCLEPQNELDVTARVLQRLVKEEKMTQRQCDAIIKNIRDPSLLVEITPIDMNGQDFMKLFPV